MMNMHGFYPPEAELAAMIEKVDKNRNGAVDFQEFLEMMLAGSLAESEDEVSQAFQVFDKVKGLLTASELISRHKDGDGLITAEEIRETMRVLGEPLTDTDLAQMIVEADLNGDGRIDFSEFSNLMKNTALFEVDRK